ncbi:SDR family oxidoreductase [Isoptericola sp. b441]|uniref:SDR family oxidoreductase n=1 Tax=Actinotalea lenta TaxID=3064654 RepID=A0ABT9DBY4_9CELL|nr:SDR family oxidoreductase [Isoptericola sp. b441]MDO8108021.1 SDR family oxidoreductase [Isoptericola sp. b441]
MRIAVVGATGRIGRQLCPAVERAGHEPVRISRALGADVLTGEGLDAALNGVDAVIDVINAPSRQEDEAVEFFAAATRTLLAAERRVGVRHHVVLSALGLDHGRHVPHYAGKRIQERLVSAKDVPSTVLRSAQLHDFPAMLATRLARGGIAEVPPLLLQPIAPADLVDVLVEVAVGRPLRAVREVAGPRTEDLVDMARRTLGVLGRPLELAPTWRGVFGAELAGDAMLPSDDARICPTTFDRWLADLRVVRDDGRVPRHRAQLAVGQPV